MFALIFGLSFLANAQDAKSNQPKGYQFTDIKRLPATSVKDQARAGTCWSWSGISFFESEMIRMGKELGIPTPYNEYTYHIIKALEEKNDGKFDYQKDDESVTCSR